ncbi:hypothetical protein [Streptomyces sp. MZ04]|uniref:hypothetical protein n=1 Tax=Streptomyces sp. MZ04 TaxID=2559236 RepID=UPI00107EC2F8|nr:hypothetical protein [Streptomyces sp. MZ04]TGB12615.1 hypothetical protein E2651_11565 [Streptomyces sp. MZ04]
MSTIRSLLDPFQNLARALQRGQSAARQGADYERQLRALTGGDYPRGAPVLHLRCRRCGQRIATVEYDANGSIQTLVKGRRRYPGVPLAYSCPADGNLSISKGKLAAKIRDARKAGATQTVKL